MNVTHGDIFEGELDRLTTGRHDRRAADEGGRGSWAAQREGGVGS